MKPRTLSRREGRWARAIFETIFPANACPALPLGVAGLDVEAYLVDVRTRAPAEAAFGLRLAIWIVALAPILVLGRLRTIAGLAQADRERVLRRLLASSNYPIRQLVVFLKAIGGLLYGGARPVRELIFRPSVPSLPPPVLVPLQRLAHEPHSFV